MKGIYFISGIDTNIGKSIATGWLAKKLMDEGVCVTTQKMIQTGNIDESEDIILHRKIMGIAPTESDQSGDSCPIILSYPASPHLAARIDNQTLDLSLITQSTQRLAQKYDVVLLEGAGGVMVPLTEDVLTIDYVAQQGYPTILVTSPRLGSINHTLLSMEAISGRGLVIDTVIYNRYPQSDDLIERDTLEYLQRHIDKKYPSTKLLILDKVDIV